MSMHAVSFKSYDSALIMTVSKEEKCEIGVIKVDWMPEYSLFSKQTYFLLFEVLINITFIRTLSYPNMQSFSSLRNILWRFMQSTNDLMMKGGTSWLGWSILRGLRSAGNKNSISLLFYALINFLFSQELGFMWISKS